MYEHVEMVWWENMMKWAFWPVHRSIGAQFPVPLVEYNDFGWGSSLAGGERNPKSWPTESDSLSKSICFEAEVCLPLLIEFVKAGWIVVECVQAIGLISTNDGFAIEPTAWI